MNEFTQILITLFSVIVGGIIAFASTYLLQRQRYQRADEEKLFENVYGRLRPLLLKAKMRDEYGNSDDYTHPTYWLTPKEMLLIDELMTKYFNLLPNSLNESWIEARENGISNGLEDEDTDILQAYDLEEMFNIIKKEIFKKKN